MNMRYPNASIESMAIECLRRNGLCNGSCEYIPICGKIAPHGFVTKYSVPPKDWYLTDPPRFTEAQMRTIENAFEHGIVAIQRKENGAVWKYSERYNKKGEFEIWADEVNLAKSLEVGETLDLAELLGKETNEKQQTIRSRTRNL